MAESALDQVYDHLLDTSGFWAHRIYWAFISFCAQRTVRATNLSAQEIRGELQQWDAQRLVMAWHTFLHLPDKDLINFADIGKAAVRFLRDNEPTLRIPLLGSDPDWDRWADTLPAAWKPL